MKNVQIIILAAGKGTRMESDNPKALAELHGKSFISRITHVLDSLELDHTPIIVVGYQKEKILDALGEKYKYVEQKEQLGTGHAVIQTRASIDPTCDTVFISYADQPLITKKTIEDIVTKQQQGTSVLTMATFSVPSFDDWYHNFSGFSRIKRDASGTLVGVVENKDATDEERKITELNPCYFAFNSAWLWEKLQELKNENSQKEYYLTDLIKIALAEKSHIETISIDPKEALGANSKKELEILHEVYPKDN